MNKNLALSAESRWSILVNLLVNTRYIYNLGRVRNCSLSKKMKLKCEPMLSLMVVLLLSETLAFTSTATSFIEMISSNPSYAAGSSGGLQRRHATDVLLYCLALDHGGVHHV